MLRQVVRVFIYEGTFCPGFQFLPDKSLNSVVGGLFHRAVELRVPHNYFALWMMTPCRAMEGARPADRPPENHGHHLAGSAGKHRSTGSCLTHGRERNPDRSRQRPDHSRRRRRRNFLDSKSSSRSIDPRRLKGHRDPHCLNSLGCGLAQQ